MAGDAPWHAHIYFTDDDREAAAALRDALKAQLKTLLPCQPCQRTVCTMNDHRCMRDIAAADIVATVGDILKKAAGAP